jgi:hypothetical protein
VNRHKPQIGSVEDGIGPHTLLVGNGSSSRRIAYLRRAQKPGTARPAIIWLGGFKSDMHGVKAEHLDRYAAETGCAICVSTIPAMARRKAVSKREPSARGSKKALPPFES